jgi:ribose/xylose/arabinose/galactoside ABC-type transport system permease subunit
MTVAAETNLGPPEGSTTSMPSASWWQRLGPLVGLLLLCVSLSIASPHFLTVDNLLNVLRQSAINAILALGQLTVIITRDDRRSDP